MILPTCKYVILILATTSASNVFAQQGDPGRRCVPELAEADVTRLFVVSS